jgi:hypothetical protein
MTALLAEPAMPSEFDLIQQFFTRPACASGALLGVGDDAALLQVSPGKLLAVSSDMLVAGRHFLPDADPYLLGHKTLAVNLSDLAAMGATPRWATLALALPEVNEPGWRHSAAAFLIWRIAFRSPWWGATQHADRSICASPSSAKPMHVPCVAMPPKSATISGYRVIWAARHLAWHISKVTLR